MGKVNIREYEAFPGELNDLRVRVQVLERKLDAIREHLANQKRAGDPIDATHHTKRKDLT